MTLTITEKDHWKTRIANKIERRIKQLVASTQRDYLQLVDCKAKEQAIEKLGLSEISAQQAKLNSKIKQLQQEVETLRIDAAVIVTGEARSNRCNETPWRNEQAVDSRIGEVAELEKRAIMESDEIGREILKLRDEQEELLDTVWLATSPKQIRDLWQTVAELLGENPTALQETALKTEPVAL